MSRIFYYLILLPLSRLPLSVLYKLSDFLYLVLYRCFGYRTRVVFGNLRNSFPEKSEAEIKMIADEFYRYFCDVLVETIRLFSMPKEEVINLVQVNGAEICKQFADQGKSILIAGGHYNNWELAAMSISLQIPPHTVVAIYHPLKNKFFNQKIQASRSRLGMELVPTRAVKEYFADNQQRLLATIFGTDQSPSNPRNAYWTLFLNQETPVFWGTELYARKYNYPVVFLKLSRISRGNFRIDIEVVSADPAQTQEGEISEMHTRILEKIIREKPEYWLWTHRRWKRTRPADMPLHGVTGVDN